MSLHTRWYLSQTVRRPTAAVRGFASAIWNYIPKRLGQWTGHSPVTALGLGLTAVTYDDAILDPSLIAADFALLDAAPDSAVFPLPASLDDDAGTWNRKDALLTAMEASLIDTGRLVLTGKRTRYLAQELARSLLLYQALGRAFVPLPLDRPLSDLPVFARRMLRDILEEHGWPAAKLPDPSTTFRTAYRTLMADPRADFGISSGKFHLGRPEANLAGAIS